MAHDSRPDRRRRDADRAAGQHRVGQPQRGRRSRTRSRRRSAAAAPHRQPARQQRRRPHRPRPRRARRARRPPRHGADQRQPARPPRRTASCRARHLRHEVRGRRAAAHSPRPCPSPTATSPSSSTTPRRSTPTSTACKLLAESHPELMTADFAILMEPSQRRGRGRLPGHPARRRPHDRRARALRPQLDGRQRHPRRRDPGPARRVRAAQAGHRRPGVPRGPQRGPHRGRRRQQRDPRRVHGEVNFRFAPDRSEAEAVAFVREVFADCDVAAHRHARRGALPGLSDPAAEAFMEAVGGEANPKFGWTDVSRFSALGVPAVNYGPGDALLAHKRTSTWRSSTSNAAKRQLARPGSAGGSRHGNPKAARAQAARGPVLSAATRCSRHHRPAAAGLAGPSEWVHTDPWRVLRIQSEFVEGFGALAELGAGDQRLRLRPHAGDPRVRRGRGSAARWSTPASR